MLFVSERKQFSRIALENGIFQTHLTRKYLLRKHYERQDPGTIKAMIPGIVAKVASRIGETVKQGDILVIIESMKMLNRTIAPKDGRINAIYVAVGEKVTKGQVMIEIESTPILARESRSIPHKIYFICRKYGLF
jgi:biotin carboxyl carrier protein